MEKKNDQIVKRGKVRDRKEFKRLEAEREKLKKEN